MLSIIRLLRPHQYIKNGFVFIGLFFSKNWDIQSFENAALAFIAFCAMASAVYIFNDIRDVESDRLHPTKKNRPLASGELTIKFGYTLSITLAFSSLLITLLVSEWVFVFVLAYALLNVGYSLYWKHIAILDVFIISAGFMLRILTGTVGLDIQPSSWIILTGLMITLFLGFSKRRAELLMIERSVGVDNVLTRRVLDDYNPMMIEQFMAVTAACSILTYSLYTVSPSTVLLHGTSNLVYTVPLVVYGIFRYIFLLHTKGKGNDTAKDLYSDAQLLIVVLAWVILTLVIIS